MNIELLNRVKAHILEEPRRLFMGDTIRHSLPEVMKRPMPDCGTIGCFLGWTCILSGQEVGVMEAKQLLGLDYNQAARLFFSSPEAWSIEDKQKLWSGDGSPETAALAARRLDEFIASDGAI